jgi:hypothetical protein
MKKILTLVCFCLMLPLVTHAAWWNPFTWDTWSIFHWKISIKDTRDGHEEININDESGIGDKNLPKSTTTFQGGLNANLGAVEKMVPKINVASSIQSAVLKPKTSINPSENFNILPIGTIDRLLPLIDSYISYVREVDDIYSERITRAYKIKSKLESMYQPIPEGQNIPNDIIKTLISMRQSEIAIINSSQNVNKALVDAFINVRGQLANDKIKYQSQTLTREQAVVIAQDISKVYDLLDVSRVTKFYEQYSSHSEMTESSFSSAIDSLISNSNSNANSQISFPPIQPIRLPEMPKTTRCSTKWDGLQYQTSCTESTY